MENFNFCAVMLVDISVPLPTNEQGDCKINFFKYNNKNNNNNNSNFYYYYHYYFFYSNQKKDIRKYQLKIFRTKIFYIYWFRNQEPKDHETHKEMILNCFALRGLKQPYTLA